MTRAIRLHSMLRVLLLLASAIASIAWADDVARAVEADAIGSARTGADRSVPLGSSERIHAFAVAEERGSAPRRSAGRAQGSGVGSLSRAEEAHRRAQAAVERQAARGPIHDRELVLVRSALLVLGAIVFVAGRGRRLEGRAGLQRARNALLILTAVASIVTYSHLFLGNYKSGFGSADVFQYYIGAKYSEELGYFGLYECSLVAIEERGIGPAGQRFGARDLRTMEIVGMRQLLLDGADCPERFSPERWQAFGDELVWFIPQWEPQLRRDVWRDFGYHPSPVWNSVARAFAQVLPIEHDGARFVLHHLDRVLIAGGFACVAWAFGWELACLVIIAWGTGYMWRYGFSGDAYLRHLWWFTLFAGVSALRLGRPAASGALLAFSTAVRVFPGVAVAATVLHALLQAWRERRLSEASRRFVIGGAVSAFALVVMVIADDGGLHGFVGFFEKIGAFSRLDVTNRVGLKTVTAWTFGASAVAPLARAVLALGGIALFVLAVRRVEDWEAPLAGLALIPFLTDPTNYYYAFVPLGFVLAHRRPAAVVVLWLACLAWNVNGWLLYHTYEEYYGASVIAVLSSACVLGVLAFGPAHEQPAERADVDAAGA